ncbi:hypothetical protein [Albimonas pacifica]|uniref:Uncharacterized protein n=1 Tax=Albimonas pacifica TaxID=1114924 RepID=A0A1I3JL66_9RHOB|nr:hypothetical protein [Albimonas pacifica]SFI61001.1 hypothetical protein SAMN05216258_10855 [Albimonas pacifica]
MPDMFDCLQSGMDDGLLNRARGQAAQSEYRELYDRYRRHMPDAAAAAQAAADVKEAAKRGAASRRHAVIAQLQRMQANGVHIANAARPDLAVKSLLEFGEGRGDQFLGVRSIRDGLSRQLRGMIPEFLRQNRRDLLGRPKNKALLYDVVREMHGEKTGKPEAANMAKAVGAAFERARSLFNAHGGDIGRLADFGLPHSHDARAMRKAKFPKWHDEIVDRLDWSRIEDHKTGKPFAPTPGGKPDPARARAFLNDIYENLTTGGWDDRVPALTANGKALYNRRAESRILHFKGADHWLAYNEAFGTANPLVAIVSHLDGMARDIALMKVLGPSPKAGLEHAIQTAQRVASQAKDKDAEARVKKAAVTARAMLAHLTGAANDPADGWWAGFLSGTRNVLTAAQLGSAPLSAASDLWTQRMAARAVGMNPGNVVSRTVQLLASSSTRETAARMGYIADTLADVGSAQARYLGDVWSPEVTETLASFVMRASGLAFWTDMNRTAFQMEFAGLLAENAGRQLADVDQPLQGILRARGLREDDWAKIADPALLFQAPDGATFLAPVHWREAALAAGMETAEAENLSLRLSAIMEEQMEFAVPSVSLEARVSVIGDAPPGTIYGEIIRSVAMYKNFALSLTLNQIRRTMAQPAAMSRASYAAQLMAGLTVMGAVSVQLKELAKGNDPRPMGDAGFWGAAVFQGGGLGIFGDFFKSETSRTGGGLAETLGGPVVGLTGDVFRAGASNVDRVAAGKDPLLGRDLVNLARRYTPGSTLWYGRLALDRLVWDQMQDLLDPEAATLWRRQERKQRRDYGTAPWWARGETAPDRAPDFANAFGGDR